jgi:hypothetical protein
MKHINLLLIILLFTISCSGIPKLTEDPAVQMSCGLPFPKGNWQFIHSIEATMPGGGTASVIGISDISSELETIHCIIMSIEGLVLFDGIYEREVVINRGIRPFDSKEFAKGLMNDIKMVYFPPAGELTGTGILSNGSHVCRFTNDATTVVDVIINPNHDWEIRQYRNGNLNRSVKAYLQETAIAGVQKAFPGRIELSVNEEPGYALTLKLIRAEPLGSETVK